MVANLGFVTERAEVNRLLIESIRRPRRGRLTIPIALANGGKQGVLVPRMVMWLRETGQDRGSRFSTLAGVSDE